MKTKSVVFTAPNKVEIEEKEIGEPGPGQILARTLKTLISTGTELTMLSGDGFGAGGQKYPVYPGYNNIGIVEKTGEGVTRVKKGDRIASWATHAAHVLVNDMALAESVCKGPILTQGGLVKLDESIPIDDAVFFSIGIIVLQGIRLAHIQIGESAVVIGGGLLGQFAVNFAKLSGAFPVICVDVARERLDIARKSGAHFVIGAKKENIAEEIKTITKGRMADVVFEVTGSAAVIPWSLKLLRPMGRYILAGSTRGKVDGVDFHDDIHAKGIQIIGAHNFTHPMQETPYNPWTFDRDAELFFDLLKAKALEVKHLISHTCSWKDAQKIYAMLLKDRSQAMGVVLDWE